MTRTLLDDLLDCAPVTDRAELHRKLDELATSTGSLAGKARCVTEQRKYCEAFRARIKTKLMYQRWSLGDAEAIASALTGGK